MHGLSVGICDRLLPPGGAPEWVHLFPGDGRVTGRDGRAWDLVDPAGLVLAFQAGGIDLPIDYEHQNDRPEAKLNGPVPAAGWIKELRSDDTGVWGRVEWTATAAQMIGRREYRFLSPSFLHHPKTKQIVRLKGAGLVHNPNLYLTALANQEDAMLPKRTSDTVPPTPPGSVQPDLAAFTTMIAELLGMPPETPQKELLAALRKKLMSDPDPAKFVPIGAVQEMLADRNLSLATAAESRAERKVSEALQSGYLSPAMKGWAHSLCMADEASFDKFIASSVPQFAHLLKPSHAYGLLPDTRRSESDELAAAICAQLGLKPDALNF